MTTAQEVDHVLVKLTDFGATLLRVQVHEGIFSFDFRPGETQRIAKGVWERILKPREQQGKPLFELADEESPQPQTGPSCSICGDTGWRPVKVPGKANRVTQCECRHRARSERLLKSACIPSRYKHCTLADYDVESAGSNRSLVEARFYAGRFIEEYPANKTGLLLIGPIGVGKTHLAVGIMKELIHKGHACLFCDYRELLKQIQNSYNPQVQTTELELLRPVFETEVLVLDELGAIRPSEWVFDTVSHILNYRYNEKKTTIITTNFANRPSRDEEEKEKKQNEQLTGRPQRQIHLSEEHTKAAENAARRDTLGDRVTDSMRSRLHEMCHVIQMHGSDFRIRVKRVTV